MKNNRGTYYIHDRIQPKGPSVETFSLNVRLAESFTRNPSMWTPTFFRFQVVSFPTERGGLDLQGSLHRD